MRNQDASWLDDPLEYFIVEPGFTPTAPPMCGRGYLYVVASAGLVKVGIAANLHDRLRGLRAQSPVAIELCAHVATTYDEARWLERATHARFSEQRHHGEWFEVEPSEVCGFLRDLTSPFFQSILCVLAACDGALA